MGVHANLLLDVSSNLKSLRPLQFNKFHPNYIIKQTVDILRYLIIINIVITSETSVLIWTQKLSEYDQEMPQSHTTDQPMAQRGRLKER